MELVDPLMPPPAKRERKREIRFREVLNAVFYLLRTGCQWDGLPHDFPPKDSVFYHYNKWIKDGTLDRIGRQLNECIRLAIGRDATPNAGCRRNMIGVFLDDNRRFSPLPH